MKLSLASIFLPALLAPCLSAQISAPSPGFVRYDGLPIESLYGVAGNLVPAPASFGPADAISFSNTGGLLAVSGRIKLVRVDGSTVDEYSYQGETPLLSTDRDLIGSLAWLPAAHALLWWNGKAFARSAVDTSAFEGRISSVALTAPQVARFLETHSDGSVSAAKVSLATGNIISSDILPGVVGTAFQFGAYLIWADERGLELTTADGTQKTLQCPGGGFSAERMSSQWVHLFFPSNKTHWALHLPEAEPTLSRLPPPLAAKETR
jgi:hypothetical protein